VELKQQDLRNQLVESVAAAERAKLAQDLHDDVLQSLTAVSLRLKEMEARLPADHTAEIVALRGLVSGQQRRLRALVAPQDGDAQAQASLANRLTALAAQLEGQWGCAISVETDPSDSPLAEATIRNLELFVAEAVANAVKHGKAKRFEIQQKRKANAIQIDLRDNGQGLPGTKGLFDHDTILQGELGSASLRQRVAARGWRMNLATSTDGTWIILEVPLAA
jgi:signal transduction histidine kinase